MPTPRCSGTLHRRSFIHAGLSAFGGLTLADLFRLNARAAPASSTKSMIVLWLWGGPSHMETFDLKPDAPAEYRGEFRPIRTRVPGVLISEHLPRLAKCADKFALIRSLSHGSNGHVNSTHTILTGHPGEELETPPFKPKYPDCFAVTTKALGQRDSGLPPFVALPSQRYQGAAYLGSSLDPFNVSADPNQEGFHVPALSVSDVERPRLQERLTLVEQFDAARRETDRLRAVEGLDAYRQKAASVLLGDGARRAFDIRQEPAKVRDRYGRHIVGQRCLLARRLVEAGVRLVTIDFPCVPGQKAFSWDDHASVWNIFEQMKIRLPVLDQVTSALIEDLHARGLDRDVLLVVMGEMSHTPKLSNHEGQPGREHWGRSMSLLMAGGGMKMGQAIGSTSRKGDEPRDRPLSPGDLLATWYRYLGVPLDTHYTDATGRPIPILPEGHPIDELG
jgi:hypothetical protein